MHIKIREAGHRDAFCLHELLCGHRDESQDAGNSYTIETLCKLIDSRNAFILVAEKEDNQVIALLIGYNMVFWGYFDVLCVHKVWRGDKIGTQLLHAAERYGRQTWNWTDVQLTHNPFNKKIDSFCEKNGYKMQRDVYVWRWKSF